MNQYDFILNGKGFMLVHQQAPVTDTLVRTDVLEVIVTLDDIKRGCRRDPGHCAIARSLRRMGEAKPHVGVEVQAFGAMWSLSPSAQEWIKDFDEGAAMAPERFLLKRDHRYDRPNTEHAA